MKFSTVMHICIPDRVDRDDKWPLKGAWFCSLLKFGIFKNPTWLIAAILKTFPYLVKLQGVPIKKQSLEKKLCISAKVAWIWATLSEFVYKYWHNVSCRFYWNNWCGSTDTRYSSLNFKRSIFKVNMQLHIEYIGNFYFTTKW